MRDLWKILPLSLFFLLAACGDDDEGTTPDSEDTSGGESTDGLERPPGTSEPDDDGRWDGDAEEPGSSEETASSPEEEVSPWGQTRAEQCERPRRGDMNSSARSAYDRGLRYSSTDAARARTAFQEALSEDSGAYKAAYNLGVLADRSGNESQALEYYRQAMRIQPDYERAAEGITTIYKRRGNVSEAVAFLEPIARTFPTNLELQAVFAEVLVDAGSYERAWEVARGALRCDERHVPSLTALVKASLAQERTELAESILTQALAVEPENGELHFIQGTLWSEEPGRFRDSLQAFERAVRFEPDHAAARMSLGIAQLAGGNYNEALQNFEYAGRLAPQLVAVHLNLGDSYRALERWNDAQASFRRALDIDPQTAEAHFNMGLMYQAAGENFPGMNALQAFQAARDEFLRYRELMGSQLRRDDPSAQYLEDLNRQIERTQRRMEREAAQQAQSGEGT